MRDDLSILLIEDDRVGALNVMRAFNHNNLSYPIHIAEGPQQALELLRSDQWRPANPRPNIILLDLLKPRQKTFEILDSLEQDEAFNNIDVYVFSVNENQNYIHQAYAYRIRGWILKPENQEALNVSVQRLADYWAMTCRPSRTKASVHEVATPTSSHILK